MKKQTKFWAITLIIMLVFTMSSFGTFALDGEGGDLKTAEVSNVATRITSKTATGVDISIQWDGNADYYKVSYGDVAAEVEGVNQYTFEALGYGHFYTFAVTPYTKAENEEEQDVPGTAVESEGILAARVNATRVSDTDVQVTWDAVPEAEDCVVNVYKDGAKTGTETAVSPATIGTATVSGLDEGMYTFSVTINGKESDPSKSIYVGKAPNAPTNIATYSSEDSINIEWTLDPTVDGYIIERKREGGSYVFDGVVTKSEFPAGTTVAYQSVDIAKYTNYNFRVYAYNGKDKDNCICSAAVVSAADQSVRPMFYRLKMRKTYTLPSYYNSTIKKSFGKGKYYNTTGFDKGRYVYFDDHNRPYYIKRAYAATKSCVYTTSWNYSAKEAEYFINQRNDGAGSGSTTNKLIWVSTYTQHVYLFEGSRGNWKCIDNWECATGKASSPTPTGLKGNKEIWKHYKKHNGLKYWSCFSSTNSFHGKCKSWKVGKPASGGCVRNSNDNAYKVYAKVPMKTAVLIF